MRAAPGCRWRTRRRSPRDPGRRRRRAASRSAPRSPATRSAAEPGCTCSTVRRGPGPAHRDGAHRRRRGDDRAGGDAFEPPVLDTFDLRSSQEIVVTVDVPEGHAPGPYRGHILATGLPRAQPARYGSRSPSDAARRSPPSRRSSSATAPHGEAPAEDLPAGGRAAPLPLGSRRRLSRSRAARRSGRALCLALDGRVRRRDSTRGCRRPWRSSCSTTRSSSTTTSRTRAGCAAGTPTLHARARRPARDQRRRRARGPRRRRAARQPPAARQPARAPGRSTSSS